MFKWTKNSCCKVKRSSAHRFLIDGILPQLMTSREICAAGTLTLSLVWLLLSILFSGCTSPDQNTLQENPADLPDAERPIVVVADILGDSNYMAIAYGGYRMNSRDFQPSVEEIKEDLLILHALGVRMVRTYNVHLPHAENVLQAISELREEDSAFEMYVMLGAWIDCLNAWTEITPLHNQESPRNSVEMAEAMRLVNAYPDIVKVLAVGNESMIRWAAAYYVTPDIILRWVNHAQQAKKDGLLPADLWITCSDNFAAWGGDAQYHSDTLEALINAVDYVSVHVYPMHDTHYNPSFWGLHDSLRDLDSIEQIDQLMDGALQKAQEQYEAVQDYIDSLGIQKDIHIGETGWASSSDGFYGAEGSLACDEYKSGLYYRGIRDWTNSTSITCFYFEAFDEPWKQAVNPFDAENHFGLITVDGQIKYALWDAFDALGSDSMKRGDYLLRKTFWGSTSSLLDQVRIPYTQTSTSH